MDVALKQRLVGALVLVALGVIFIPMILDGSAQRARQESTIEIPQPPDMRFETRRLALNPDRMESTTTEPSTPVPTPQSGDPVPEVVVADPRIEDAPGRNVILEQTLDSETNSVESAPDPVTPVNEEPEPEEPNDEVRPTPGVTGWALQLGSFGKRANAQRLVEQIQELGISAYSETITMDSGTVLYRVRAGAFATQDDALDAGDKITQVLPEIEASLRQLAPGDDGEEDAPLAGFMVQVGSFADQSNAMELRDRLRNAGYSAHLDQTQQQGKRRYRVRVGPEIERADAQELQRQLKAAMKLNGIIVTHP